MNNIANAINVALLSSVFDILGGDYNDAKNVKKTWFNINYLLFSVINYSKIFNKATYNLLNYNYIFLTMQKMNLLSNTAVLFFQQNQENITKTFHMIFDNNCNQLSDIDLSLLHEYLLGIELRFESGLLSTVSGKNSKDITGAYYTPSNLAEVVVEKAFNKYEEDNGVIRNKLCIADLSCGGGEFFRAAQKYLYTSNKIEPHVSSTFFWGIDVDPIALQNTICYLLSTSREKDWKEIISHFFLGNPLVCGTEGTFDEKCDMFATGRIYSTLMGIDFSKNNSSLKFDIVLGNPPWEKIRFEERKFFANLYPEISAIAKKNERDKRIEQLRIEWPEVYEWTKEISDDYASMSSTKYVHPKIAKTVVGELNTYALFSELAFELTKPSGICSLIVKSALATSPVNKIFWNMLMSDGFIDSVFLFDNKKKIFLIDSREKFCVITLTHKPKHEFLFMAGLQTSQEMKNNDDALTSCTYNNILTINPFTKMLPNVNRTQDMQVLLDTHKRLPVFEIEYPDCHFGRLIHLTAHASSIDTVELDTNLPIYEGKFIEQYDARYSTFAELDEGKKYASKASSLKNVDKGNGKELPMSRYFVHKTLWEKYKLQYPEKYSLCWRSLTSNTNTRTTIAMILPTIPTCQSIQLLQTKNEIDLIMLLGLFNSIPFDYFVRLKMPGIDLTQSVIKQIPVPPKSVYDKHILFNGMSATLREHIISHLYCLLSNEPLVSTLFDNINSQIYTIDYVTDNPVIRKYLDELFAYAYGLDHNSLETIIKTFRQY